MCYYNSRQLGTLQITTTFITINDRLLISILDNCYHNLRFLLKFTTYHKLRQNAFSVKITDASKRSIKNLIVAISWRVLKFRGFRNVPTKREVKVSLACLPVSTRMQKYDLKQG